MLPTTLQIVRIALQADPSVTPADRTRLMALIKGSAEEPKGEPRSEPNKPQVLRRSEVALRLARSLRTVDKLASDGLLRKFSLPGRKRAAGFLETDVAALIASDPEKEAPQ